ncbi:phospholipase D family protein [Lysobacter ciconiae]|uniref:Phospholipase D family protein n=2 Tax=Novilysobacter ciconiae TaxID=2781022 RepID=A0A7S6ZTD7_9GAMM|nr:phospholipase D family protein [Lysobacter ciconiae]
MVALAISARLPSLDGRSQSTRLVDTADTLLGRGIQPFARAHPGVSGVLPLARGDDAFAARVALAEGAQRSLDVQYYIWRGDMSGTLLLEALHRAADRGVRVRLLLDDNNTAGLDPLLATLDTHPLIEVRLFNPFPHRNWRWLDYLTDFARLNRRMHNKSFTADNQATIMGGRNVGDEYFDAGDGVLFVDLDLLAVGPIVDEVSLDFDLYWASGSSYPLHGIVPAAPPGALEALATAASVVERDPAARAYLRALDDSPYLQALASGDLGLEWVPVELLSDDPAKGLGLAARESLLSERLQQVIGVSDAELQIVSPYFVPTAFGVEYLAGLAREGVKVTVLTNSLAATDVTAVHAGYAKRRKPLLDAGITLYEMKPETADVPAVRRKLTGSSASSLHAKVFAADRRRAFIGSFNFDPRSANLNTEMGLVVESTAIASGIANRFEELVPDSAWLVRRGPDGKLEWVERGELPGEEHALQQEPGNGFWLNTAVRVMEALPIEWLL